jgi:hypothetical protein
MGFFKKVFCQHQFSDEPDGDILCAICDKRVKGHANSSRFRRIFHQHYMRLIDGSERKSEFGDYTTEDFECVVCREMVTHPSGVRGWQYGGRS